MDAETWKACIENINYKSLVKHCERYTDFCHKEVQIKRFRSKIGHMNFYYLFSYHGRVFTVCVDSPQTRPFCFPEMTVQT